MSSPPYEMLVLGLNVTRLQQLEAEKQEPSLLSPLFLQRWRQVQQMKMSPLLPSLLS